MQHCAYAFPRHDGPRAPARSLARILGLVLAATAPAVWAAGSTLPGVLNLIESNARVQWGGPGLGQNQQTDPWFVSAAAGGAEAQADLGAGTVKARSSDLGNPSGIVTYAYGNFEVLLRNTGAAAIGFGAGGVNATVDASLLRAVGLDAAGTASHNITASLYGQGGGLNGGAGFSYPSSVFNGAGSPVLDFDLKMDSGFTATGVADLAALSVALAFPAFNLDVGQTLRLGLSLMTSAWAYAPAGGLWSATTDAFNTARISMALPEGTSLVSAQPLTWGSVVQPATHGLLLAGLLGLAWRARRHAMRQRPAQTRTAAWALAGQGAVGHGPSPAPDATRMAALGLSLLAAPLSALAQNVPLPAMLTVTDQLVIIGYRGVGLGSQDTDPWFSAFSASTPGGALSTSADLPSGALKSSAEALGGLPEFPLGVQQSAQASFRVSFQNTGPGTITLPSGWLQANVDAVFSRVVGAGGQGAATHNFTASLGGNGPGLPNTGGNARLTYNVSAGGSAPPTETLINTATPGFASTVNAANLGGIDGTLSFAALSLPPGSRFNLNFGLQVLSAAPVGAGWAALTDASNSAVLSMVLPAGVTLDSPVPLSWVTVVPEPATSGLLLAGLLGLAGWRARQRLQPVTLRWAIAAAAGLAGAGASHAQLVVIDHEVVLQLRGPGLPNTTPRAPWFLEGTGTGAAGTSYALADLAGGGFKVSTDWTGAVDSASVQQARAIGQIEFRNDGASGITFAAGAIHVDLTGSFGWAQGAGTSGISNQLYSRLVVTAPAFPPSVGGISNTVLVYDQNQSGFDLTEVATPGGAGITIRSVSAGALDATLGAAGFTLAPGETARLSFTFEAQSYGRDGWSAFVDAAHSAQLSMQLPVGVTLDSPVTLPWVSVVPEPATGVLLLAGLLALAGRQARQRTNPCRVDNRATPPALAGPRSAAMQARETPSSSDVHTSAGLAAGRHFRCKPARGPRAQGAVGGDAAGGGVGRELQRAEDGVQRDVAGRLPDGALPDHAGGRGVAAVLALRAGLAARAAG